MVRNGWEDYLTVSTMTDPESIFQLIREGDEIAVVSLVDEASFVLHLRNLDSEAWQERTPIHAAGADNNARDAKGRTALDMALAKGLLGIPEVLRKHGAE